jgi:hypothetical protein
MATKPSAKRITAAIKSGIPRRIAILREYDRVGKLSKKYKGYTISKKAR